MPIRVLIADDDPKLLAMLRRGLRHAGFEVVEANDGPSALGLALSTRPDLVVLDVGMPIIDGYEVCRQLRASSSVPVLMLTARHEVDDRVAGLRGGADDYLTKPFAFEELVARLEGLSRRAGLEAARTLGFADVTLDVAGRTTVRDGREIELTRREFDLLELLLRNPRQVLPTATIWERVWGDDLTGQSNSLAVTVGTLRRKLGEPPIFESVRGVGYRLRHPGA
jgi:two-component system, OmpR family, response regulator MprA